MEQLQEVFSTIEEEIISRIWNLCNEDLEIAAIILRFIVDNNTTFQQQSNLMRLLKRFGNKINKITILKIWRNCKQIYADTREKLKEICRNSNLDELNVYKMYACLSKEENEIKILREICLHILWNILKYPKRIKYHFEQVFMDMEKNLQYLGFKKGDDNNSYYQNNNIQSLLLWHYYKQLISQQIIYKTRDSTPERVCMLSNGKWKDYEILFDYQHRTIMLFDENKLKIKLLQLGNPNKLSPECNVHIQFYNDLDVNDTHAKWACLILNHTWHFRTIDFVDRDDLSNFVSVNKAKYTNDFINCTIYLFQI
ncbi:hypothetical protein RFI_05773 [Reticulomyxa filosa]|uniref:Uncharacterized protein n=1 Tax=Reticulomyxa filosa TaxID=46433 RepID=X6P1B9_RETFI|nr:hypothetical protein RFI_05773 [Reticulomyxa filosa]|eukprot:ETO31347.1 hypothetical protein RFI_05773 [Reticulomyxa filosa]